MEELCLANSTHILESHKLLNLRVFSELAIISLNSKYLA